jgi:hypothetical protein
MNNNYNRILVNIFKYLNEVSITGIQEANNLAEAALFVNKIMQGEFVIVETPKGKPKKSEPLKSKDV